MAQGGAFMDALSANKFKFRDEDRDGNVGEIVTTRIPSDRGGSRTVRGLTIVYHLANGSLGPEVTVGETIFARGLKLKIDRIGLDETALTLACIDFAS